MRVYNTKNPRLAVRDYGRHNYGNPLFKHKVTSKTKTYSFGQLKKIMGILFGLGIIGFGFWYFFWGPTFTIQEINLQGASSDTEMILREGLKSRLSKRKFFIFPQSSIFLYDTQEVEKDIRVEFYLDSLEIHKKLPRTISVAIKEKTAVATLFASGEFLLLDESGFVIRTLNKREQFSLKDLPKNVEAASTSELDVESIVVTDMSGLETVPNPEDSLKNSNFLPLILDREGSTQKYRPGDQPVSKEILALVLQTYNSLPNVVGSGIKWFALDMATDTVNTILKQGWQVYLTTVIPFDIQSERLALVLKEKIDDRISELEYIDLRYDERIFFRFKGENQ